MREEVENEEEDRRRNVKAVGTGAAAVMMGLSVMAVATPALATVATTAAQVESFSSGLYSSLVLILASEIGDKTFFISALLAMKYSKSIVFLGSIFALGMMTVISVLIGQVFHALPSSLNSSIPFDDYAAIALLLWFGFQNLRDGLMMDDTNEEEGELKDAEEYLKEAESGEQKWWRALTSTGGIRLLLQTFSLVFVAEWGDKSMLATIALAAAKSPVGVVVGGVAGHFIATVVAVLGGSLLGKYISEKTARLVGGVLFFVFAILTLFKVY